MLRNGGASRLVVLGLLLLVATVVISACSGGSDEPEDQATQATQAQPDQQQSGSIQMALASSDLSVGTNRLAFGLIDAQEGPIRDANVQVATFRLTASGASEGPIDDVVAVFRKWPVGAGGVYTVELNFDTPGDWGIGAVITEPDGNTKAASARVTVAQNSKTPALGSPAPLSISKTAGDVGNLEELTSDTDPDPDFYSMTIAEALGEDKPLMVVFSTPAYCQTATCGPQLDTVKGLKQQYADRANFIHIEVYDNPLDIQGDLSNAIISPTLTEWNLPSEPWTFIMDSDGIVRSKFEAFVGTEELEQALAKVLR